MLKKIMLGALLPLMLTVSLAEAQSPQNTAPLPSGTTAGSPGKSIDAVSWSIFAASVAPVVPQNVAMFETWASDPDTFAAKPVWPSLTGQSRTAAKPRFQRSALARVREAAHPMKTDGKKATVIDGPCTTPLDGQAGNYPPPPGGCIAEEVRRNRPAFDYIVGNKLYTLAGLQSNFKNGRQITFPWNAVEVKVDWAPISDIVTWLAANGVTVTPAQVQSAYFTTTDNSVTYGLLGFHIESKILPDWLWATWEHQWNPGRCDTMGCYDNFGATTATVLPQSTPNTQYGACAKSADVQKLFKANNLGAVWNNYCLKETQTAFTNNAQPLLAIIDGNSVSERMNAGVPIAQASCISCHQAAAFDTSAGFNPAVGSNVIGNYTNPPGYKTYDFVWGFLNIKGIKPGK